jgi:DNA repair photolyase
MVAPVIPHLTDGPAMLREVVRAAVDAGATHITPIHLHLRPVVREHFMGWLHEEYPDLVRTYEDMYRGTAYGPKKARDDLAQRIRANVAEAGGLRLVTEPRERHRRWNAPTPQPATPAGTQLKLL